jgi:leader peptidase (prepilin peptidase)/N-methyltransferase
MDNYIIIVTYILAGLIGLCVGSFLNVVIYRVPNGMNISKPASHCTKCGYELRWYDNIPILSYLMLGGKCRKCKEHISIRYTLVEIFNMLLWLLSVYLFFEESIVYCIISMIASSLLICIFFIDLEHMLIFNRFSISIAILGIIAMFFDNYTNILDHIKPYFTIDFTSIS